MKKETKKISTELAIGIILVFSIIVAIAIYRVGSFSAFVNYIPQKIKNNQPSSQPERILFATNGTREIYKVKKDDGKWVVVIDGQEGEAYDEVFNGVFSDDGTQFAYGARNKEEEFVVLDNQAEENNYESIGQIIFGKDGELIYKVTEGDEEFLVIDGQEGQHYTSIGEIVILDDGRVAFQAELNGEQVTVIDGQVVVDDSQGSTTGTTSTGTTGSSTSGSSSSGSHSTTKKYRQKTDRVITPGEKSYPICTGDGCNF